VAERHATAADELIEAASVGWPLERMAVIDRLVLRWRWPSCWRRTAHPSPS